MSLESVTRKGRGFDARIKAEFVHHHNPIQFEAVAVDPHPGPIQCINLLKTFI